MRYDKEAKGCLEVIGELSLEQLWPSGSADADTATIHLEVGTDSFRFRPHAGASFRSTRAFEDAVLHGRIRRPVLARGRVTVRLQGVDSPELHFTPPALLPPRQRTRTQNALYLRWNERYRQPLAETAVRQLRWLLSLTGRDPLPCRVLTHIDQPGEVFDCYGRLVGELFVPFEGREVSVNSWLVRQGWAFPSFYESMTHAEIKQLLEASHEARQEQRGVWKRLGSYLMHPDLRRRYRKTAPRTEERGQSRVLWPKLFRRQITWAVGRRSKMVHEPFWQYLSSHRDLCYEMDAFLCKGVDAPLKKLSEFLCEDGFFERLPQGLVLKEAPSRLVGPDGRTPSW